MLKSRQGEKHNTTLKNTAWIILGGGKRNWDALFLWFLGHKNNKRSKWASPDVHGDLITCRVPVPPTHCISCNPESWKRAEKLRATKQGYSPTRFPTRRDIPLCLYAASAKSWRPWGRSVETGPTGSSQTSAEMLAIWSAPLSSSRNKPQNKSHRYKTQLQNK